MHQQTCSYCDSDDFRFRQSYTCFWFGDRHSRSEGLGFNACIRTFKVGKNTLKSWDERFYFLQKPLFLYSLCHTFLAQVIEGDELYTKVKENKRPCDSEGWTIILMEKTTRFIWHIEC